ncbi:hypothetical protein BN1013_01423 [Candidatus Rubidus massiliensis]|nr:MAG: sporulation protein RMD1 [Chlamydia sp. 32-24]CDZ80898.1 hypothetical protein BN1013_01423 [Candidatus Rubidus massiliensis]
MDCRAYCTATAYKLKSLYEHFRHSYQCTNHRDVVHIAIQKNTIDAHIFCFSYGATIIWGLPKNLEKPFFDELTEFEIQSLEEIEKDEFTYVYGDTSKIVEDEIILTDHNPLTKLAISHGIAQSVKLGTFETAIQKTFNQSKDIPQDLAKHGRIPLSRKEIRRKMGELFIERNSVNLNVDVLDTPEFFWEYPELEQLYLNIANYLDLETRVDSLNHRLDVVHELFQMLNNELNHQHSSRLEWIIILLIVTEVLLSLMRDVFKII